MKKMLTLFFAGCALIGLGLGVFCIELREWKVSDFREDLKELPRQTYTKVIDFNTEKKSDVNMQYPYYNQPGNIKVVHDKNYTNQLKIDIVYHGGEPYIFPSGGGAGGEVTYYHFWIETNNYQSNSEFYNLIKHMFDTKTYYRNGEYTYIDSITLYTAHPENLTLSGYNVVAIDQTDEAA